MKTSIAFPAILFAYLLAFFLAGCCGLQSPQPESLSASRCNLLRNGSFEEFLEYPEWIYLAEDGKDFAGFRFVSSTSHVGRMEFHEAPEGKYVLQFHGIGPATLASRSIPYHGGRLTLRGWIAAENLRSKLTSTPGVIQLAGLDQNGTLVDCRQMATAEGDFSWRPFERTVTFPQGVAKVVLWVRTLPWTLGMFWVDALELYEKNTTLRNETLGELK